MASNLIAKRKSKCKCDLLIGTCSDITCPRSLSNRENKVFWVEGWALSKYSAWSDEKTEIGSLIHNIKYQLSNYSDHQRKSDSNYIKNRIIEMIKLLYDKKDLPFDTCLSPISHKIKPLDLAEFICLGISGGSIKYLRNSISEKKPLGSMMDIPKNERCQRSIDNYNFNCRKEDIPKKGVLIIDDVFDTGCTLKGISKAITEKYSGLPIFVITAAYIGQMGRISAT